MCTTNSVFQSRANNRASESISHTLHDSNSNRWIQRCARLHDVAKHVFWFFSQLVVPTFPAHAIIVFIVLFTDLSSTYRAISHFIIFRHAAIWTLRFNHKLKRLMNQKSLVCTRDDVTARVQVQIVHISDKRWGTGSNIIAFIWIVGSNLSDPTKSYFSWNNLFFRTISENIHATGWFFWIFRHQTARYLGFSTRFTS